MEAGFLLGNKASKNASRKSRLVAKIKNIDGKLIGKDDPSDSTMTKVGSTTNSNANDHTKPIHVAPIFETIPVADGNDTTIKHGPNDALGLGFDGANVAIPMAVVNEICDNIANTLYGYFIGERLAFPIVEAYVENAWAKYGFERAIFRNCFFFFKFSSHEGMVKTIEGEPWFIRSMPIFLHILAANTKLKKEEITKGQKSYALVLVELSSESAVLESIVVAISLPKGEGHYLETLDVEYEWWPSQCSKYKIFDHEDEFCPIKEKKTNSDLSSSYGYGFSKPKSNFMYRPVSKPNTNMENIPKPNVNTPSCSKEGTNRAGNQPSISPIVAMNDSSCFINENGYFKDDIDLAQLRNNIEKFMDEDKVLDLNMNNDMDNVVDTMNSTPNTNMMATNIIAQKCRCKNSDESEVEEVCMPDVIPGGGFLDGWEDDLDCYDGYEAQVYNLNEGEQAFCDQYDIRLNSRHRK
ncbi:zinc knuckle CX2CX4HX4C containing protein [Tanacetum coccineum]